MSNLMSQLAETTAFIQSKVNSKAEIGIILGSGLGNLSSEIKVEVSIPYSEIPHFPVSTVEGHGGSLILGELSGKKVWVMSGRFHFYEGYTPQQVTYPVRAMHLLGVKTLLLSNAAGGVNPAFSVGDLMVITDHISLFVVNPLLGKNEEALGTRFPDMSEPYDHKAIAKAKEIAKRLDIKVSEGVYVGLTGPTLETPAEYKYVRIIGGDAVGMSTVPEVIAARHAGLPCFGISIVTDLGVPGKIEVTTHEDVQRVAAIQEPKMTLIMKTLISEI